MSLIYSIYIDDIINSSLSGLREGKNRVVKWDPNGITLTMILLLFSTPTVTCLLVQHESVRYMYRLRQQTEKFSHHNRHHNRSRTLRILRTLQRNCCHRCCKHGPKSRRHRRWSVGQRLHQQEQPCRRLYWGLSFREIRPHKRAAEPGSQWVSCFSSSHDLCCNNSPWLYLSFPWFQSPTRRARSAQVSFTAFSPILFLLYNRRVTGRRGANGFVKAIWIKEYLGYFHRISIKISIPFWLSKNS